MQNSLLERESDAYLNGRVGMHFIKKYRVGALMVILCALVVSPFCLAQIGLLQENLSGAYLGITMEDVTAVNMSQYKLNSERGVIVRSVQPGSPAEKASLREKDVLIEFGGHPIWSSFELSRLVQETPVGRKVDLGISRDGNRMTLNATIERRDTGRVADRGKLPPRQWSIPDPNAFPFRRPDAPDQSENSSADKKPQLGVTIQPLTDQLAEFFGVPGKKGVLISSVISGSPSDGKLKSGDVIIAADDMNINNPEELTMFVRNAKPGEIKLKIIRNKKESIVPISLSSEESKKGYRL